jgi:hypothetical protein
MLSCDGIEAGLAADAHLTCAAGVLDFANAAVGGGPGALLIAGSPKQLAVKLDRPSAFVSQDGEHRPVCNYSHRAT